MKRIAVSVLALAIAAAAGGAVSAQDSRYSNDSRYDNRYDNNYDDHHDNRSTARSGVAQVIRVQPRYRYGSYERQECWNEQYDRYDSGYYRDNDGRLYRGDYRGQDSNVNGTLLGAIIGGALGNQVGKGDGRKAATIGGAVVGGVIGNNMDRNHDSSYNDGAYEYRDNSGVVRRCRTVNTGYDSRYNSRRNIHGYDVTYRYAGQTYHTVTRRDPGRSMRVIVDVRPQDEGMAGHY